MKSVNPLYIGLFLVLVLGMSLMSLNSAKTELNEAQISYKETMKIATNLSGLKNSYANKKTAQSTMKRILNHPSLKSSQIVSKFKKSGVSITSKSMDKKALDFFMAKILNATFNVEMMDITKLSEQKSSFKMEIKW